jgi:L-rhamnose mutarotase
MRLLIPSFLVILTIAGCGDRCDGQAQAVRHGWIIAVKPEMVARYKDLHAHPWPGIQRMISACHIRDYSIWLKEVEPGKWYLFSQLEYTGSDFAADMARMAADETTQRWWAFCKPCQQPLADRAPDEWWSHMEEVFHTD